MRLTGKKRRLTNTESNSKSEAVEGRSNAVSNESKNEPLSGAVDPAMDHSSRLLSKGNEAAVQPDDHKKLAELFSTEYISAMKMKDNEVLDMSKTLIITDSWRNEWNRGVQVPVDSFMPAAAYRDCPEVAMEGNFVLPQKMIRTTQNDKFDPNVHERPSIRPDDESCRYDLDDLDCRWRVLYNCHAAELGLEQLDEDTCERAFEYFESICYDKLSERKMNDSILGIEFDEDSVCDVCQAPESEDSNEMVFCDSCNVAVHQMCYGIPQVPAGTWFCRACAAGVKPTCILCPITGGAFKSTRSGTRWCHVSCALWIPEVGFHDPEYMEPVTNIAGIPESRWLLRCSLCRERKRGACVQCEFKGCNTAFHVTCAQRQKLTFQLLPSVDAAGNETVIMKQFCLKHSDHPTEKPVTPDEGGVVTREIAENKRAKRLEEIEDEFFTCVDPTLATDTLQLDPFVVATLFEYWKLKRKSNFNKPLMRAKKEEDQIMERQQEDILYRKIRMLIYLRQNLETARNLCYMVVKREKSKKQWYQSVEAIFDVQKSLIENSSAHLTARDLGGLQKMFDSGDSAYDRLMRIGQSKEITTEPEIIKKSYVPVAVEESEKPQDSRLGSESELSSGSIVEEKRMKKSPLKKQAESSAAGQSSSPSKSPVISLPQSEAKKVEEPVVVESEKKKLKKVKSPSSFVSPRKASLRHKQPTGSLDVNPPVQKPSEVSVAEAKPEPKVEDNSVTPTTAAKRGKEKNTKRKIVESKNDKKPESPLPIKRALRSVTSKRVE